MHIGLTNLGLFGNSTFSPASLFLGGYQGAWYDPSDLNSMYQDSAGTTPVTGVEKPVGKILDKSGNGNHATQSTTANRPTLSARVNQLIKSEKFDDIIWTSGATVTPDATIAPDGTLTGDLLTIPSVGNDRKTQAYVVTTLGARTYSISAKPGSGSTSFKLLIYNNTTATPLAQQIFTTTAGTPQANGWYRHSLALPNTGFSIGDTLVFYVYVDQFNTVGSSNYFWGADVRFSGLNAAIPPYQRVNTSTDYDTAGFPLYLAFNGTNSCMVTGSIDFSALKVATIFAGLQKNSDATFAAVVEQGIPGTDADAFTALCAPRGASASYGSSIRDGLGGIADVQILTFAAPDSAVITLQINYAGVGALNQIQIRRNGVLPSNSVLTDTCTNINFGNHPFNIGARSATGIPANFFTGNLYGLCVIGKTANTGEIAQTEAFMNSKTRAY